MSNCGFPFNALVNDGADIPAAFASSARVLYFAHHLFNRVCTLSSSRYDAADLTVFFSFVFNHLCEFGGKGRIVPRRQDAGGGPEQSEG